MEFIGSSSCPLASCWL